MDWESDSVHNHPTKTPITVDSRNQVFSRNFKCTVSQTKSENMISELPPTIGNGHRKEITIESPNPILVTRNRVRNRTDNNQSNQILQEVEVKKKEPDKLKYLSIWGLDEQSKNKVWELLQSWLLDKSQSILDIRRIEQRKNRRIRYDIDLKSTDLNSILKVIRSYSKAWKIYVRENINYSSRQKSLPKEPEWQQSIQKDVEGIFKFATWNIHSINNKEKEIELFIDRENIAILAIQETWRYANN